MIPYHDFATVLKAPIDHLGLLFFFKDIFGALMPLYQDRDRYAQPLHMGCTLYHCTILVPPPRVTFKHSVMHYNSEYNVLQLCCNYNKL